MSDQFVGEIRPFAFNFAPIGWALCNGQILSILQYSALFSLLGTSYGGNGTSTFGLPNLQGNVPICVSNTTPPGGLPTYVLGEQGGTVNVTLNSQEMPLHKHTVQAASAGKAGGLAAPAINAILGSVLTGESIYSATNPTANTTMAPGTVQVAGGNQPHNNMQPYLTINFCIALTGIYPVRQ